MEPALSSSPAGKLHRNDNGPAEALFLRSFDRLEEILHEAVTLQIGQLASEFTLGNKVNRLQATGFLTRDDRREWASCLIVRRSLLCGSAEMSPPSMRDVEAALVRMLRLQVVLTDRRRLLFDTEMLIRHQEDAALREVASRMD